MKVVTSGSIWNSRGEGRQAAAGKAPMAPHYPSHSKSQPIIACEDDSLDIYFGGGTKKAIIDDRSRGGESSDGDTSGGIGAVPVVVKAAMEDSSLNSGSTLPANNLAHGSGIRRSHSYDSVDRAAPKQQAHDAVLPSLVTGLPPAPVMATFGYNGNGRPSLKDPPAGLNTQSMDMPNTLLPPAPVTALPTGYCLNSLSNSFLQREMGIYHPHLPLGNRHMIHEDHSTPLLMPHNPYMFGQMGPPPRHGYGLSGMNQMTPGSGNLGGYSSQPGLYPPIYNPPSSGLQPTESIGQTQESMKIQSPPSLSTQPLSSQRSIYSPSPSTQSLPSTFIQRDQGSGRVYQEKDWKSGRIWREDNHAAHSPSISAQYGLQMKLESHEACHANQVDDARRLSMIEECEDETQFRYSKTMVGQMNIGNPVQGNSQVLGPRTHSEPKTIDGSSDILEGITSGVDAMNVSSLDHVDEQKSRVSFGNVKVRTHESILVDNPSCSGGPALGIGWRYDPNQVNLPLNHYELRQTKLYGPNKYKPDELVLQRTEREEMLQKLGYTDQDLARSVRKNVKVKKQRRQTVDNLSAMWFEERVEAGTKVLGKFMKKRESSKHVYDKWKRNRMQSK